MIALAVAGGVVVLAVVAAWARALLARRDERSVEGYEHTLHVLGDVSRRSEAPAHVRPLAPEEVSRAHVRAEGPPGAHPAGSASDGGAAPERASGAAVPRIRIEVPSVRFEDESDAYERSLEEARAARAAEGEPGAVPAGIPDAATAAADAVVFAGPMRHGGAERPPRRQPGGRARLAIGAAVVVVLAGLVAGGVELASGSSPSTGRHGTTTSVTTSLPGRHGTSTTSSTGTTPSTTSPGSVRPLSTSPSDVVFQAPGGSYTVGFAVSGLCWLGIQQSAAGPYVWQDTLQAGQSTTYRASGTIIIRVGAAPYFAMTVNGVQAQLPSYTQPYDVTFQAS